MARPRVKRWCLQCGKELEYDRSGRNRRYHPECFKVMHDEVFTVNVVDEGKGEVFQNDGEAFKVRSSFLKRKIDPMKRLGMDYVEKKLDGEIKMPKGMGKQIVLTKMDTGMTWD